MTTLAKLRARIGFFAAVAVIAAMLAVGAVGWWMSFDLRSTSAALNGAIIDAKTTAQVQAEVSKGLTEVLSYDYADPGRTTSVLDSVLKGDARKEYDTLFAALQKNAPGQQLVLTATVQGAAVRELEGDTAKLLVFLDQSSQRATDKEASVSAAQLSVTARRTNGAWLITKLKPL
jgi:Mce-associated membrane protein